MNLYNIKDKSEQVSFAQAVRQGLGREQGLFFPETIAPLTEVDALLDLPLAERSAEATRQIAALIRTVARDRTVLMVEHNMSVVADLSDTITVLARGEVLAEGDYAEVSSNPRVVEAYLGQGTHTHAAVSTEAAHG